MLTSTMAVVVTSNTSLLTIRRQRRVIAGNTICNMWRPEPSALSVAPRPSLRNLSTSVFFRPPVESRLRDALRTLMYEYARPATKRLTVNKPIPTTARANAGHAKADVTTIFRRNRLHTTSQLSNVIMVLIVNKASAKLSKPNCPSEGVVRLGAQTKHGDESGYWAVQSNAAGHSSSI